MPDWVSKGTLECCGVHNARQIISLGSMFSEDVTGMVLLIGTWYYDMLLCYDCEGGSGAMVLVAGGVWGLDAGRGGVWGRSGWRERTSLYSQYPHPSPGNISSHKLYYCPYR